MDFGKEHVVAGLIGGFAALGLFMLGKKTCGKMNCCKGGAQTLTSDKIPKPIGPYTAGRAVSCGGACVVFSSGQIGVDPKTGELVSADVKDQTHQALLNLKNLASDNGLSLDYAIKCNLYIVNMADFAAVNEVYKEYFTSDFPARTCVAVQALPKNAAFEIEAVFFKA